MEAAVLFREYTTPGGHRIGYAELNSERTLNSLTIEMIRLLQPQLDAWAADAGIVVVVLSGRGSKAFCAGGDVRRLQQTIVADAQAGADAALQFFTEEYRLDHAIHRYPKPILVWGSGVVMGGGLGLMVGASHRVVTPSSKIAMPEIRIGLFPDVGGSYFLSRLPRGWGLFVGMTAALLNAHDAIVAGLATHLLSEQDRDALFSQLESTRWHDAAQDNHRQLDELLRPFAEAAKPRWPESNLLKHGDHLERLAASADFRSFYQGVTGYDGDDHWLAAAATTLRAGSPTTAVLVWELQRRLANASLGDVFRTELVVAVRCCAEADFVDGVRALLVDKDNQPSWSPASVDALTPQWVEHFFESPDWPSGRHPLAELD
ncbi:MULTISPECIES: enoyl-CoA hydratase/isomerase family protein [Hydrocarboniphaga]|uniref:enoyl-CoA hydratase/isomerase family protein n=1 Tax=Hydrocarboniphaga TaxID=243627 RepID=UPI002ABA3642|nr:enoyl-CoA hydratase/isomerase family protein [Hydrocarboniphaga sp.]MDZ4077056.1 enoyl-CoA hydratase/isomerase family protein [Hydrocarboniphaga sp.]